MSGPLRRLRYDLAKQPWSLRYIFEKATQQTIPFGLTEAFGEDGKKEEDIPAMELMRRINEQVLDTPLCKRMLFRGEAMAPAISCAPRFSSATSSRTEAMNMLVVRPLRHEETTPATHDRVGRGWYYPRPARVGDVVAFVHPDSASRPAEQQTVLVRRVAALAGDVLVSGGDGETPLATSETAEYELPRGRAWVTADNDAADSSRAADSRAFGPIGVDAIVGRVIYYVRSATDHGPVANHPSSADEDAVVLATEVRPDALAEDLAAETAKSANAKETPATPPP